jgi:AcrR family transcriptional regulator
MTPTRRDRQRAATLAEIKGAALSQIADVGAASLSIRGIARDIGMSPAGLYRYYDGLDALITDLLTDAYNDLADAVSLATGVNRQEPADEPEQRLRAGMLAYRTWAVQHPNRFLLIFGTPIPGYSAPQDGPTVAATRRLAAAYLLPLIDGWRAGRLAPPAVPREPSPAETAFAEDFPGGYPGTRVAAFLDAWGHFHGLVTLEILQQLHWIYPDPAGFYAEQIDRILASWRT